MPEGIPVINIDKESKAIRQFFEKLGDEPVLVQHEGRVVYVIESVAKPSRPLTATSRQLAGELLSHVRGAWTDVVPDEICEKIAVGE